MRNLIMAGLAVMIAGCSSLPFNDADECPSPSAAVCQTPSGLLKQVQDDPDFHLYEANGWLVAIKKTETERAIWSFTPSSHPASLSVVKRDLEWNGCGYHIDTRVLCDQPNSGACALFVAETTNVNEALTKESLNPGPQCRYLMYEILQVLRAHEWGA